MFRIENLKTCLYQPILHQRLSHLVAIFKWFFITKNDYLLIVLINIFHTALSGPFRINFFSDWPFKPSNLTSPMCSCVDVIVLCGLVTRRSITNHWKARITSVMFVRLCSLGGGGLQSSYLPEGISSMRRFCGVLFFALYCCYLFIAKA